MPCTFLIDSLSKRKVQKKEEEETQQVNNRLVVSHSVRAPASQRNDTKFAIKQTPDVASAPRARAVSNSGKRDQTTQLGSARHQRRHRPQHALHHGQVLVILVRLAAPRADQRSSQSALDATPLSSANLKQRVAGEQLDQNRAHRPHVGRIRPAKPWRARRPSSPATPAMARVAGRWRPTEHNFRRAIMPRRDNALQRVRNERSIDAEIARARKHTHKHAVFLPCGAARQTLRCQSRSA